MVMPFGKYKGTPLEAIEGSYLVWMIDHAERLSPEVRVAILEG